MDARLLEKARAIMHGATRLTASAAPVDANRPATIPYPEPSPADDPIISVDAWYPTFHQMHVAVVAESPDFDYGELKQQNLELYSEIKAAEAQIDALEDARLSEVMAIMTEWRGLILKATFEQRQRKAET